MRLAKVQYDPPGDDDGSNASLNKEYVQVRNFGAKPWTLTGWSIRDVTGFKFAFPEGFTVQPGDTVTSTPAAARTVPCTCTGARAATSGTTPATRSPSRTPRARSSTPVRTPATAATSPARPAWPPCVGASRAASGSRGTVGGHHPHPRVAQRGRHDARGVDGPHQDAYLAPVRPAQQPDPREQVVGHQHAGAAVPPAAGGYSSPIRARTAAGRRRCEVLWPTVSPTCARPSCASAHRASAAAARPLPVVNTTRPRSSTPAQWSASSSAQSATPGALQVDVRPEPARRHLGEHLVDAGHPAGSSTGSWGRPASRPRPGVRRTRRSRPRSPRRTSRRPACCRTPGPPPLAPVRRDQHVRRDHAPTLGGTALRAG